MRGAIVALAVMMGAAMAQAQTYKGSETPAYSVDLSDGAIEVRAYASHIMAEVTVSGDRSGAINRGFRLLAGYIFGGNETKAKVAMTSPVVQTPSEQIAMTSPVVQSGQGDEWVVQFMMPQSYTMATLPVPKDDRVRFVTTKPERQAVIRFSGLAGEAALKAQEQALRDWAAAKGMKLTAGPRYYFYDSPMTLPWNRRNEVAFSVQ